MTQAFVTIRDRTAWRADPARLFLVAAILLWVAPVAVALATTTWTTEQGAQGPIILVTGLWLLAVRLREAAPLRRPPTRLAPTLVLLLPCLFVYVLALMVNMVNGAVLSVWAGLIVLLYAHQGGRVLRPVWFPLAYLLFLIPPPVVLVDPVVQALKRLVAAWAVEGVAMRGGEVAVRGSSLFVDQYELLVAAACSGMNSIFGLSAVGLFYVHVRHAGDWRAFACLALAIVPVALATNLIRVMLLLMAVHLWGARVLDTPLHMATGLAMVVLALAILALVDRLLTPLVARRSRRR